MAAPLIAYRATVVVMAADGAEDAFGLAFAATLVGLACALALEVALGVWSRRHPLGDLRRVVLFVTLRASQPLIWALAAVGLIVPG